ncbi:MAG: dicarboxylate/amino acid:cation symporter [Candidatus Marinimicrobia bacterium]|nr:dicarboxylate/amino acid:cation symporter [Candidatus Neomarinimicrobiota bacterium]
MSKSTHNRILVEIVIGILLGLILGGFLPGFAIKLSIFGDIFINALMMIVVPIVMFSIINGITNIGNFKALGSLGKNTMVYYLATTAIAVSIGLFLVNIIQPGKNLTTGEIHEKYQYSTLDDSNHFIQLDQPLIKNDYDNKYKIRLMDQDIYGVIDRVDEDKIYIAYWLPADLEGVVFIHENKDEKHPFKIVNKRLVSAEPAIQTEGTGVEILLSYKSSIADDQNDVLSTLKTVVVGNRLTQQEGMVPRNLFNAMVRMDILPLIIFSILFGSVLASMGNRAKSLVELFSGFNDAFMVMTGWILEIAPLGIFGLISSKIGIEGGFKGFIPELFAVGKYSFTVIAGLFIHGTIVLPIVLYLFGKSKPWQYLKGVATPLLNAFSSASSSASLPLTINAVENNNHISSKTAGFVLPLGATINMDGTALYEAVAALFIAQIYGIDLGFTHQLVIFLTATLAAIGAAGIPQAGLVTMVIVLKAVNLPVEGIGIILTVDWLLDRFRTVVNVWGDCVGCAVVEQIENK